jgi:hypothetical protein
VPCYSCGMDIFFYCRAHNICWMKIKQNVQDGEKLNGVYFSIQLCKCNSCAVKSNVTRLCESENPAYVM